VAKQLTIDGVILPGEGDNGFCLVKNLWVLMQGPDVRGADRLIPGAAGVRPYPRRATVTKRVLELSVWGDADHDGAPHEDGPEMGLEANLAFLRLNVADPTNVGDGTRTATLLLPSGDERSGPVHIEGFEFAIDGDYARAALTLSIPGGVLS
jgi:hypothetical protein